MHLTNRHWTSQFENWARAGTGDVHAIKSARSIRKAPNRASAKSLRRESEPLRGRFCISPLTSGSRLASPPSDLGIQLSGKRSKLNVVHLEVALPVDAVYASSIAAPSSSSHD